MISEPRWLQMMRAKAQRQETLLSGEDSARVDIVGLGSGNKLGKVAEQ